MIEWLTDTLVMTGVFLALVLGTRRAVGRWFGAGAAYALWALPMIRLILPPLALPRGLLPQFHVGATALTASNEAPLEVAMAPVVTILPPSKAVADTMVEPGLLAQIPWTSLLICAWLAGAALFLIWRTACYRAMRRALLKGARQVARSGDVRIIESPVAAAPLAFGVFDKVIALPAGFLATADSETSDLAIAHELEHHAGSDLLALMAMQPLFALHWFNPLAWAAWRALRSDQEAACDARVMTGRGKEEKALYGRLIASFAGGGRLALIAPMAGPLAGRKPIIHRLRSLAHKDVGTARRALGRSLFALAVLTVPVTATVSYAAMDQKIDGGEWTDLPSAPVAPMPPAAHEEQEPASASSAPEAPDAPAAPATRAVRDVAPVAAAVPSVPEAPSGWSVPPAAPAPPVPPVAGARRDMATHSAHATHHADHARVMAAQAQRMAEQAIARAPRVEETVSADGRKVVRITRWNEQGQSEVSQEMVIDDRCPADSNRSSARAGRDGTRVVICTGTPASAKSAELDALRATRSSIAANRQLDAQVRAEVLADLDSDIAEALRERDD